MAAATSRDVLKEIGVIRYYNHELSFMEYLVWNIYISLYVRCLRRNWLIWSLDIYHTARVAGLRRYATLRRQITARISHCFTKRLRDIKREHFLRSMWLARNQLSRSMTYGAARLCDSWFVTVKNSQFYSYKICKQCKWSYSSICTRRLIISIMWSKKFKYFLH